MRTPQEAEQFRGPILDELGGQSSLIRLFDPLPNVSFYAKDRASRLFAANPVFLRHHGFQNEWQVIGLSDHDFHQPENAARYTAEDRRVMRQKRPLPNQQWMVPDADGTLRWWVSSKTPLFSTRDPTTVIGIAGAMYEIGSPPDPAHGFHRLERPLRHIHARLGEPLRIADLARLASLSPSQFIRRFRATMGETPVDYILRARLNTAARALIAVDRSVAEIALACGFSDPSYFTKRFRRLFGITPTAYRDKLKHPAP